ncbi:MAG TPA: PKD domain-containing protein [Bacteroidales bacterium]|nr:PKD domain-containing protein [Bacteroidales bacterium]
MKTKPIYLLLILAVIVIIPGCTKYELGNPSASTVAEFSYSATNSAKAPCEVAFTNESLNAAGYYWDFGNGQTSTEANPVIQYDTPGLYTVTLTCTPVNDVYYNSLVKTIVLNIKDPNAGRTQVLYFTTRGSQNGGVHYVILSDSTRTVQDFPDLVPLPRPYGICVDTTNMKVYVADYSINTIYRFNADGTEPLKILDGAVAGQEMCDSPQGLMVVGDKLYWGSPGGIFRCNLDGSNPENYNPAIEYPLDMHWDSFNNKIRLVNDHDSYSGGYFEMNFDGTGLSESIPDIDGTAIDVNVDAGKVYIAGYAAEGTAMPENGIYMSNLDGTQLSKIGEYGSKATWGIAIDNKRNKLFWGVKNSNSNPDGKIVRSNLDGSGLEDFVTNVSPHAMQIAWIKL